jgi:hypothetical protein
MKQVKNTIELLNNTINNYMKKTRARTNTSITSRSIILILDDRHLVFIELGRYISDMTRKARRLQQ